MSAVAAGERLGACREVIIDYRFGMNRPTRKHDLVLETLLSAAGPMSANELWEAMRSQSPETKIGIATVYRSLKKGVEAGQLVAVELESGSVRYESANLAHHHHFLCSDCSRAFDVEGCVENLDRLLPEGFEMDNHEIVLYGRCADCRVED